ncbi:hypothetical protein JIN77_03935 [Verrucomicrobiaceae bacterium R5-34]|nr:hypothetical protein [Verrucomicrobiaceae bacterium R5-34]
MKNFLTTKSNLGWLILLLMLATQLNSEATSYAKPQSRTIKSANGQYTLITNPKSQEHQVYASKNLNTPLWSFKLVMWHFPIYLSNDGQKVCHLAWRHVREDQLKRDCVTFRNAQGIIKSHPFSSICPNPPKTQAVGPGPIGDFWRTWYREATSDSETVTVRTTRDKTFTFSFKNGKIVSKEPR